MPRLIGPNATSSKRSGIKSMSSGSWKTIPIFFGISCTFFGSTVSPRISTAPRDVLLCRMPFRWRRSVDLPAPFGPTSATDSPFSISNETCSSAAVPSGYV